MLIDFLRANADIFAWSPSDMPGIPREVAEHSLDIRAGSKPVKQRLCRFDEEKRRAIGEEIHKLLAAGFLPGKDLSSSPKSSDPAPTNSPTKQGRSSRTRGTLNNYVAFTLRIL